MAAPGIQQRWPGSAGWAGAACTCLHCARHPLALAAPPLQALQGVGHPAVGLHARPQQAVRPQGRPLLAILCVCRGVPLGASVRVVGGVRVRCRGDRSLSAWQRSLQARLCALCLLRDSHAPIKLCTCRLLQSDVAGSRERASPAVHQRWREAPHVRVCRALNLPAAGLPSVAVLMLFPLPCPSAAARRSPCCAAPFATCCASTTTAVPWIHAAPAPCRCAGWEHALPPAPRL